MGRPSIDPEPGTAIAYCANWLSLWHQQRAQACRGTAHASGARFADWQGKNPQSIAADASYGNGELLQCLMDRQITPYMPTRDAVARTRSPLFGPERFTYHIPA